MILTINQAVFTYDFKISSVENKCSKLKYKIYTNYFKEIYLLIPF